MHRYGPVRFTPCAEASVAIKAADTAIAPSTILIAFSTLLTTLCTKVRGGRVHGSAPCEPVLARQHSSSRFGNGAAPANGRNPSATLSRQSGTFDPGRQDRSRPRAPL